MEREPIDQIIVRDAVEADLPDLVEIKGSGSEALHHDRFRDALSPDFRYLVIQAGAEVTGYGCLVFRRPAYWSDGEDTTCLPCIVDLRVKENKRGQGFGTLIIRQMEHIAFAAGCKQLFISVQSDDNPRAYSLYQRLGYKPLQSEPYLKAWEFTDSGGVLHHGEDWLVDMVKDLSAL